MQVKLWEVESKLRNLYSPKPQDQQIDVCIIDTGQLVCQSLSVLPSQSSGSLTLHCHLWRCQCPMKACHLPLPAGILQRELEGQYWSMWGQWNPTRGSALRLPVEPPTGPNVVLLKSSKKEVQTPPCWKNPNSLIRVVMPNIIIHPPWPQSFLVVGYIFTCHIPNTSLNGTNVSKLWSNYWSTI